MQKQLENDQFVSPEHLAQRLSVSRWTVYRWVAEKKIKSIKIGRLVRISESEIQRFVGNA